MIQLNKRERLTRTVRARVTDSEARLVESLAELNGATVSEIIRAMISQWSQAIADGTNISSETTDSSTISETNNEGK
jgi:hypothetical protein